MNQRMLLIGPVIASLLALAACEKKTPTAETPGQKLDSAIVTTETKSSALGTELKASAAQAKKDGSEALSDAAITTRVNAQLATDPSLSALKINVDTSNGHVRLSGTAPDDTSRERATTLVTAVSGVVAVDNQLKIDKKS